MSTLLIAAFFSERYQRQRLWTAFFLYALVLALGCIPGARADVGEYASGVVLHSGAYAFLAFLLFSGVGGAPAQRALKAVLMVAVMGALDETIQTFFPYRHGAVSDWVVDCCAASVTSLVLWSVWPRLGRLVRA